MGDIHVYLENGFDHDLVTVSTDDEEHTEPDVSTRYQVGLATVVVELSDSRSRPRRRRRWCGSSCPSGVSLPRPRSTRRPPRTYG